MEKIDFENKEVCEKCGGMCCKKCGCDYFVSDLDNMKIEYLETLLDGGRVSIVAAFDFERLKDGKLIATPILYLRARNKNRGAIDLFSMKTTCASLEDTGCHYSLEDRPSGGTNLIPVDGGMCYSLVDRLEELKKWLPYQKVLQRIVKKRTGITIWAKLKEDIENVVFDLLANNVEGISIIEISDLKGMLPLLKETYPLEVKKAYERYKKFKPVVLVRNK